MRLKILDEGHSLPWKAFLGMLTIMNRGVAVPDVIKTLTYRPAFFGRPQAAVLQRVMRGRSEWTPGEREVMAGVVSSVNQCPF